MQRRDFIKTGSAIGLAATIPFPLFGKEVEEKARIGFIGVGLRGRNHLHNLLLRKDVLVPAICDIDPDALAKSRELISSQGYPAAEEYSGSEYAYRDLLDRKDMDGVIISTPWLWHTRMSVDAMRAAGGLSITVIGNRPE